MNGPVKLPLTKKQKKVLQFIIDYFDEKMYPPTYKEIGDFFNHKSPGHAYAVVKALVNKGYLEVNSSKNRSIRLTDISEELPTSKQLEFFPGMDI